MNKKSISFREAWCRGWKFILMLVVIHFAIWLLSLPLYLLPEGLQGIAAIAYFLIFGPPLYYWVFTMFYPQAESVSQPKGEPTFTPTVCFSCTASIPVGSSVCPECGWMFKPTNQEASEKF